MLKRTVLLLAAVCLVLSGCATIRSPKELDGASRGWSKDDIIRKVGRPAMVRGILKNKDGETVEVWEYKAGRAKGLQQVSTEIVFAAMSAGSGAPILLSAADTERYWAYIVNGAYAGWSPAGDWEKDADKIRQNRFLKM